MPAEWNDLFLELKCRVIDLLDYESRCNIRICSKNDKQAVDSTKFVADSFKITEIQSEMARGKTIIRINIDTFTIYFIGKDNITKVDKQWNYEPSAELCETKEENRFDVARRFIDRYSYNGLIAAKTIEIHNIAMEPMEHWKLKCDNLVLVEMFEPHDFSWLRKARPEFKSLEVGRWEGLPISEFPHIMKVSDSLKLYSDTDVTDAQLRQFTATNLKLASRCITKDTIKFTILRFLKFAKRDDVLELEFRVPEDTLTDQFIPNELLVKKKLEVDTPDEYNGTIFGGFTNVNGVQDNRSISCNKFGDIAVLTCQVKRKPTEPHVTWPFTQLY